MIDCEEILKFWFADSAGSPAAARERNAFWFGSNEDTDRQIWSLFADSVSDAAAGHYDSSADEPDGRLTLIILLDQFPRNMYRGTAEVFRHDARALAFAREGVEKLQLKDLSVPEQAFFLMPYQHAESLEAQQEGVRLYNRVVQDAPEDWTELAEGYRDFAVRHHDIIAQFGRFPHRNQALGRKSTPAEVDYLESGGDTFGQAG